MDAMSDAIEGADVVLYGVSRSYKESGNCRLECQYATQQDDIEMIPLMMEKGCEHRAQRAQSIVQRAASQPTW